MGILFRHGLSLASLSLLLTCQTAWAQQITIDFEEFNDDTDNTAYTKGYIFTATNNSGYPAGGAQPNFSPSNYFRAYASKPACGSGCFATAASEFHLLDGGPFAFYSVNTHAGANPFVDVGVFEGQSAADGTWFSAVDYPDFGQGPWLNVTSIRYSLSKEAVSSTATVQLRLDDVVVAPLLNAGIDFEPWDADNEARPQDDYFFAVAIKTLSMLDGEARDFDATTVNPATATFGPAHAPNIAQPLYQDIDNDGDTDIVLGFRMERTGITCMLAGNEVKLVARTNTGETIAGTDTITKTGCDGTERLDFEELPLGTAGTFISKGFLLSGAGGSIMNDNGDKVFGTPPCDGNYGGCYFYYASVSVQRADGKPFALYSLNRTAFCGFSSCDFSGETVQGDVIYDTPSTPVGTGGWLSLRSVRLSVSSLDWPCWDCRISIDDLQVGDGTPVEIDFNPWSSANEIRPKVAGLIAVQINTTSIADGDAVDFDAATVDPASLRLGPSLAEVVSLPLTADYDHDGDTDYIFGFRMEDTGYTCSDGLVEIYGNTVDAIAFSGRDSVQPVGCEEPMPINVEPYSNANRVYPDDNYLLQVAVLSTSVANGDPYNFTGVTPGSLRFGPAGAQHQSYFNTDVEPDGDTDTVYTFRMIDTGIACGDVSVTMTGSRSVPGGDIPIPLIGTDSIQTLDCEVDGCHP